MRAGVPESTRNSNAAELRRYERWCQGYGRTPFPATAETLASFVSTMCDAAFSPASMNRAISAICVAHRTLGLEPPETKSARTIITGYRREEKIKGAQQAPVLLVEHLVAMLRTLDATTLAGKRDRALIALGWSMMARRSELAALDVDDIAFARQGVEVFVASSKTDQEGIGAVVRIPKGDNAGTCPVMLLQEWMAALGATTGPLFRPIDRHGAVAGSPKFAGRSKDPRMSPKAVWIILDRAARTAGVPHYSPHSLRSGGATAAYVAGAGTLEIARHGRWKEGSKVLLGYIRPVDDWAKNPMKGTGL